MNLDDDVCLCFHVSCRKLIQFMRAEKPVRASQLSSCGGAGTGCGWCVPVLEKIFESGHSVQAETLPVAEDWSAARAKYLANGKVRPPPDSSDGHSGD